ncbi:MAG TPA: translocation/assembly module TamB domain-containing protein [Chiayiivirga sp.]|nr:translocation/assembly module TamB domain-containing protein [Chiayiivirga sp.]
MSTATTAAKRPWRRALWLALLIVPVLCTVLAAWLLRSGTARDLALAQLQSALGPDALQWRSAEGALTGGLVLEGVRWRGDGIELTAQRLELDVSARALLVGDIDIDAVKLKSVRLRLPAASDAPVPWPERIELPSSLPSLALPVAVRVDSLVMDDLRIVQGEVEALNVRHLAATASLVDGRLRLKGLTLDSDRIGLDAEANFNTARDWRGALTAELAVPIPDAQPMPITLRLNGPLKDLRLDAKADLGAPATLKLRARGGLQTPTWNLDLDAPRIEPAHWGGQGEALALTLHAQGDLATAQLEGRLKQGDTELAIAPSQLSYRDATLTLAPLAVSLLGGEVMAHGTIQGAGEVPVLAIDLAWSALTLPASDKTMRVQTQGKARIDGSVEDYALSASSRFVRAKDEATVDLRGRGSTQALQLESMQVALPNGGLRAHGEIAWQPQLATRLNAQLEGFDPSYFLPDFPGKIDARVDVDGAMDEAGVMSGEATLEGLSGQLRGLNLAGRAQARATPRGDGEGRVELSWGDSQLAAQGRWGDALELDAQLQPLALSSLLPDADGQLEGHIALRGTRKAPELEAQVTGRDLAIDAHRIAAMQLEARLDANEQLRLDLAAQSLSLAGHAFKQVQLEGRGERGAHSVTLTLDGAPGSARVALRGGLDAKHGHWQGWLDDIQIEPAGYTPWHLREPTPFAVDLNAGAFALQHTCLDAAPAFACATVEQTGSTLHADLELEGFELGQLDAQLREALARPASVRGTLAASAQIESRGEGWAGRAELRIPTVALTADDNGQNTTVELTDLMLAAQFDPEAATLTAEAKPGVEGHLHARLQTATPFADDGALSGELELLWPDLAAAGLFTEDVVNPSGRIEARFALGGTRNQPDIDGALELVDVAAEVPALGIHPREGHLVLRSAEAGHLDVSGTVRLGEGIVRLDGQLDRAEDGGLGGRIGIKGDNLGVVAIPEAKLTASPDLTLELTPQKLKLRGTVAVPFARIDLERMESVIAPSSDVVVVDGADAASGMALDSDITVHLGEDVRLSGFGLKGTLAGQLRVRDRPGRASTARGSIEVGGKYKAYGQDLTITRGQIAWAATPLDTPSLDIRAERKIDAITVGVQVRGTSAMPELSLWSKPAMEQAEQVSYLVLGRPLRSATQAEGSQLSQAAAALGGNLLAKSLGARMGLDEVEVADNRALGGAALTVGMYLSPRLHVSYGVALFGTGQVITFKYLLNRLWNIQLDSGTEDRVALNYRLEK